MWLSPDNKGNHICSTLCGYCLSIKYYKIFFPENQNCRHQFVHERLGEVLRVLKAIINKHPNLYSVDVLSAAGTVIAKVRGKKNDPIILLWL